MGKDVLFYIIIAIVIPGFVIPALVFVVGGIKSFVDEAQRRKRLLSEVETELDKISRQFSMLALPLCQTECAECESDPVELSVCKHCGAVVLDCAPICEYCGMRLNE